MMATVTLAIRWLCKVCRHEVACPSTTLGRSWCNFCDDYNLTVEIIWTRDA